MLAISVNDIFTTLFFLFSFGVDVSSMPARVCGMASALRVHFSDALIDTGGFNPLLLSRCVRCAVKQRCWRISRNAILQGGKSGATGGQREGSMRTVKTFYLHRRWVGALSWSRRVASRTREGTGNKWHGEESARPTGNKRDYGPAAAAHQERAGLCRRRAPTSFRSVCQERCLGGLKLLLHVPFLLCT